MAEATLNDVSAKLSTSAALEEVTARGVEGLRKDFQKLYGLQEKLLRQLAEAAREGGASGGDDGDGAPAAADPEKKMNPFFAAAIVAAVAVFTAVKDYFGKLSKMLKLLFKGVSKVFKGFLKISRIGEYASDIAKSVRGSIKAVFAVMGKALKTLVPDGEFIKDAFKGVKGFFKRIKTLVTSGADDFLKFFTESSPFKFLKNGFNSIKQFIFGSFGGDDVKGIKSFASGIMQKVSDFFKPIRTFFSADGPIAGVVKFIRGAFSFASEGSGFMKMLTGIGRVIGKLAWPITVIMSIIDGITGAFKGFVNTDGSVPKKLFMGLIGGISGVFEGLIGVPLDLLKSAVSWILGKMGFENAEKFLDSFSFADLIRDIVMSPIVMIKRAFNGLIDMIADAILSFDSVLFDTSGIADTVRGFKFDDTGESRTEMVARKKQDDKEAGEALDKFEADEKGFGPKKYKSRKQAQIAAKKQGLLMSSVAQDDEGNFRVVNKGKGGPQEIKPGQMSGKSAKFIGDDLAPAPATMPGGAPIVVQDNSSQVSGGGTVLAGETRPSTGNGQAMKTGFVSGVGG